jgi:hypothetical protein
VYVRFLVTIVRLFVALGDFHLDILMCSYLP